MRITRKMKRDFRKNKDTNKITFTYITNLLTKGDSIKSIVYLGRQRWRIENEGFNEQKNGTYNITHMNSRNDTAMKAHYLFIQFDHTI